MFFLPSTLDNRLNVMMANPVNTTMVDYIHIEAECLCKKQKFRTSVPRTALPLEATQCHCESCRHTCGALSASETAWPEARELVDISRLKAYEFSSNTTFRFCGECSALMFYEKKDEPHRLGVFTGVLSSNDAGLIRFTKHTFVDDTKDGGATVWLKQPNQDGSKTQRFRTRETEVGWDQLTITDQTEKQVNSEPLAIWCHCKGVQLQLHPGNYAEMAREELPWFIDPRNNKRLASHDVCDSCRYSFGNDIVNWTFAKISDVTQLNGTAIPADMWKMKEAIDAGEFSMGTLGYCQSSPDVLRFCCKNCCASMFYACEDRADVVDIAVGVIEAPEGARAEDHLSWEFGRRPSWLEDAKGWRESLMERVQSDGEQHRLVTGYPESYRAKDQLS